MIALLLLSLAVAAGIMVFARRLSRGARIMLALAAFILINLPTLFAVLADGRWH